MNTINQSTASGLEETIEAEINRAIETVQNSSQSSSANTNLSFNYVPLNYWGAPSYSTDGKGYVDSKDYEMQQHEQIFDLDRNGESKRFLVHHSAGDMGAWAYTTLTDRTALFDPSLRWQDMSFRKHVIRHEFRHQNGEYETENAISPSNKTLQDSYPNVRFGV